MGNLDLTPDNFVDRLKIQLACLKTTIDKISWSDWNCRTSVLKGDNSSNRKEGILCQVSNLFGYRYSNFPEEIVNEKTPKITLFESEKKDMTLATGFCENWAASAWNGRYKYDVVLELENKLEEFQMTVRGLFDIRASLYIGVFYVTQNIITIDDVKIPRFSQKTFKEWSPRCLFEGKEESVPLFHENDKLLIIFLSASIPEIKFSKVFKLRECMV